MPNALRIVAWIIGALLAVLAVAFAWGRLRPPTPAQAETLGLLRPMPMPSGQNAWPILWLLDYDVPTDRIDAVYAQERAHMRDWASRLPASPSTTTVVYKPLVAAHYPKRPAIDMAEHKLLCASREDGCLAKARAGGRPLRDLLARQSGRLAQVESMNAAAALWDDLPISNYMYAQLPGFANTEDLLLTATAVDFVDGRQAQALAAVCRQAAGVRRLHAQTNTLITAMIANAWMEADERVLAGMLRELPPGHAVPAECMQAFAPPTPADVSLCAPMQHEFEGTAAAVEMMDPDRLHGFKRLQTAVLFDARGFRRLLAPAFAWACRQDVQGGALADRPISMTAMPAVRYDFFDAVSNAAGLVLARIATPAYAQYAARNEDYASSLRVTAWLLRTRATAATAADWQRQLAQALPMLRKGGSRSIGIDPDGRLLRMRYYAPRPGCGYRRYLTLSLTRTH